MIRRIDHIGLVAHDWKEARAVFLDKMGFDIAEWRGAGETGSYFAPERTLNYFIKVGEGETVVEIIVPQDDSSGAAKFLAKRGAGLHHIGYAVDDVKAEAERLAGTGMRQVDLGPKAGAAFFFPKDAMGVLTELVPFRNPEARLHTGTPNA